MKIGDLKKAEELIEIIKVTEEGLKNLKKRKFRDKPENRVYDDGVYNLYIGEYSDGSGIHCELSRYTGNRELHDIIVAALEMQLDRYKKEFEAI
jgi:hypothetical protein